MQCEDAEGCSANADFTYVWPGGTKEYAGCTRHAYKAAAVVGNMGGLPLELVPIGGGSAVTIGGAAPAAAAPTRASREQIDELEEELDHVRKRVSTLERLQEADLREHRGRTEELERRVSLLEKKPLSGSQT